MKIFNNNNQIELFNNDNIINIVNEEKTIINKQNFLTQLIFTDANTKTTLDTINNITTVTATVRATTVKIQKADKSNFNTDIEIIGSLTLATFLLFVSKVTLSVEFCGIISYCI